MKSFFITLLLGFPLASLIAQDIEWQDGSLKLVDSKVFNEKISYDPEMEVGLVFVKNGREVLSLTPNDVVYFILSNEEKDEQRKYYSLPLKDENTGYTRNYYFEVLYESNSLALLSRDILAFKEVSSAPPPYDGLPNMTKLVPYIDNKFYMIEQHEPALEALDSENHFGTKKIDKKIVYSFFDGYEKEMRNYIKENMLKLKRVDDLIHALTYFSKLKNQR